MRHETPPTSDTIEARTTLWAAVILGLILALAVVDLAADLVAGATPDHLVVEGLVAVLAGFGSAALVRRLRQLDLDRGRLEHELRSSREQAARWRAGARTAVEGVRRAIDRQLDGWELTPAEKDVAWMLLRGHSHQQIAGIRGVSERTVRQQAHLLYRKAGLGGRADLAAFFLDELLESPGAREEADLVPGEEPEPAERRAE